MTQKIGKTVRIDRTTLFNWLLNVLRIEHDMTSDVYCFQVLTLEREGAPLGYWRVNQPKGKFTHCGDPQWQRTQDQRRRAQSQQRATSYSNRRGNWDRYQPREQEYQGWGHHGQDTEGRYRGGNRSGWNTWD